MPGKSGIEGLPALLQAAPQAKVLVLSMQDDPRYVREAFEAGASGYVLKEAADTEVRASGRRRGALRPPGLGARLVAADAEERKRAEADPLSEREREVLASPWGIRTRRSQRFSTSRCVRPRHTARTSCRSSVWRAVPSSCATRSTTG